MTRGQKVFAFGYAGLTGLSALIFVGLFIVIALSGCGTAKESLVGPAVSSGAVVSASSGAYIRTIEYEGKMVKAWVVDDRSGPLMQTYKIIMILDYPCGFIGPIPDGHGRDCTDTSTPSDEPAARYIGDPTSDD